MDGKHHGIPMPWISVLAASYLEDGWNCRNLRLCIFSRSTPYKIYKCHLSILHDHQKANVPGGFLRGSSDIHLFRARRQLLHQEERVANLQQLLLGVAAHSSFFLCSNLLIYVSCCTGIRCNRMSMVPSHFIMTHPAKLYIYIAHYILESYHFNNTFWQLLSLLLLALSLSLSLTTINIH